MSPFNRQSLGRRAKKREQQLAKKEGGYRIPGSGSGRQKGDVRLGPFLVEDKFTDADSYRLSLATIHKIEHEARSTPGSPLPQLRITIGSGLGQRTLRCLWEADYQALHEEVPHEG